MYMSVARRSPARRTNSESRSSDATGATAAAAPGLQMKPDEQQRMVRQVGADARQVGAHRDAVLAQMRRRADAAAHQHGRRMDAAELIRSSRGR